MASTITPSFLDEIRTRVSLSDVVGRRIVLTRAGKEQKAPCPFHGERTPSFYINDSKGFFHCFGCGAHGDAVGFLMRYDNLSFPEAVEQLAASAGLEMPKTDVADKQKYDRLKLSAEAIEAAAVFFEERLRSLEGRHALAYLESRGLSERTIAEFRLGYAPKSSTALIEALARKGIEESALLEAGLAKKPEDERSAYGFFRDRIMFPISDKRGRIVAFSGRVVEGDGPKYINSPEHALYHKGSILFGLARARVAIAQGARPIVVEGNIDVAQMQQAGFLGAVAPMGTALTEAQLDELWRAQTDEQRRLAPPILCFDGDAAGRRAAERTVQRTLPLATATKTVVVALLPTGEDPDSLIRGAGAEGVQAILDRALTLTQAVWEFTAASRSTDTAEARAHLVADLGASASLIADSTLRAACRDELRQHAQVLFSSTRGVPSVRPRQRLGDRLTGRIRAKGC